jgi:undecaprenyl-diphosphatase
MSIPIIGGAVVLKMAKLASDGIPEGFLTPMIVGVVAAAIAGWIAIASLLRLVSTRNFLPYVAYRFVAGAFIMVVAATHWR